MKKYEITEKSQQFITTYCIHDTLCSLWMYDVNIDEGQVVTMMEDGTRGPYVD